MEAILFLLNLIAMLLLVLWSARVDPYGFISNGRSLFEMKPGADCDERISPFQTMQDF
jgi:hypothetical protein